MLYSLPLKSKYFSSLPFSFFSLSASPAGISSFPCLLYHTHGSLTVKLDTLNYFVEKHSIGHRKKCDAYSTNYFKDSVISKLEKSAKGESKNWATAFPLRGMLTYSANNFQNTMWCRELFFYLDNVCGLKLTLVQYVFLDRLARWPEMKSMSLKITSSRACLPQSRGFGAFQIQIFLLERSVWPRLSLDLNSVQKARVQERIVQECHVYAALYILHNTNHLIHKHQSTFYEITNQVLGKYYRFKVKSRENTK